MQHKKGEACAITSGAAKSNNHNDSLSPLAYKPEHNSVLYEKIVKALEKKAIKRNAIIPYPEVNRVMSWRRYRKDETRILLFEMEKRGLIKNIPYHGIKILKR